VGRDKLVPKASVFLRERVEPVVPVDKQAEALEKAAMAKAEVYSKMPDVPPRKRVEIPAALRAKFVVSERPASARNLRVRRTMNASSTAIVQTAFVFLMVCPWTT